MSTIIGTRKTQFFIDGVDYTGEVSQVILSTDATESSFVSFEDALAGGLRDYTFKLKIRQDTDTNSLWYVIWGSLGDDLTYEFWPNGGSPTPGTAYPKFSGILTISEPKGDLLGGEANASPRMVNTVDVEWKCTARPTLTTV